MIKALYLLGAGFSRAAGYKLTDELTNQLFSTPTYCAIPDGDSVFPLANRVIRFLQLTKEILTENSKEAWRNDVNFEVLYSTLQQVTEDFDGIRENPALVTFRNLLEQRSASLPQDSFIRRTSSFDALLRGAIRYIRAAIAKEIAVRPCCNDYARELLASLQESCNLRSSIVTLNFDLLIENTAEENGGRNCLVDGFVEQIDGLRRWDSNSIVERDDAVCFLKLHGSVDWYWLNEDGNKTLIQGKPIDSPALAQLDDQIPELLIGTVNKDLAYSKGVYLDLHYHFYRLLQDSTWVVVCGYGFRDVGVNSLLLNWANTSKFNKIYVVHPNFEQLTRSCLPIMKNFFDRMSEPQQGRLFFETDRTKTSAETVDWRALAQRITREN